MGASADLREKCPKSHHRGGQGPQARTAIGRYHPRASLQHVARPGGTGTASPRRPGSLGVARATPGEDYSVTDSRKSHRQSAFGPGVAGGGGPSSQTPGPWRESGEGRGALDSAKCEP